MEPIQGLFPDISTCPPSPAGLSLELLFNGPAFQRITPFLLRCDRDCIQPSAVRKLVFCRPIPRLTIPKNQWRIVLNAANFDPDQSTNAYIAVTVVIQKAASRIFDGLPFG
jgi:hypothetical protein